MSFLSAIPVIGTLLDKVVDKALPDRSKANEAQSRINEAEIAGSPPSRLRLWRSFLGWILSLCLAWEIVGRLIIIPIFFKNFEQNLPPSSIEIILKLLLGMLGLGL